MQTNTNTSPRISSFYLADERRSVQPYGLPYGLTVAAFRSLPIAERWRLVQREVLAERWSRDLTLANEDGENRLSEHYNGDGDHELVNEYNTAELPDLDDAESWDDDDAKAALDWLDDRSANPDEFRERIKGGNEQGGIWLNEETGDSWEDICSEIADACRDHESPQEIYQWFRCDSFLARDLAAIGEPVMDGELWGRTCCGQGVTLDGTLQRCADLHLGRFERNPTDEEQRAIILATESGNSAAFPEAFANVTEWQVGAEWASPGTLRSILAESNIAAQRLRLLAEFNRQNVTV